MLFINKGMLFVNKGMLFINTELFHPSPKREGLLGYYCSGLIKVIDSPSGSFRTNLVSCILTTQHTFLRHLLFMRS